MKTTDNDIITSLLDDSSPILELEKKDASILQDRVVGRVMRKIGKEKQVDSGNSIGNRTVIRHTSIWGSLSVAASILILASVTVYQSMILSRPNPESPLTNSSSDLIERNLAAVTESVREISNGGEALTAGPNPQHYALLSMITTSISTDGALEIKNDNNAESIRITQPMRLEFIGGDMRINSL